MLYKLAFSTFIISMLFAFQNCSKGFNTTQSLSQTTQCTEKLRAKAYAEGEWLKDQCRDLSAFRCNVSVFSPDIEDRSYDTRKCLEINGKEACVGLDVLKFSTKNLLASASEATIDFQPGGSYNRSEYNCTHPDLYKEGVAIITAEADSLEDSLLLAQQKCLEGGQ
jgi:hypothetical protein